MRDVTERKKAEESLRKLSQAVEQSPVNVIITDLDGNIEYVNRRFSQVTGYTLAEVLGKNPRILKSGHTSDEEYRTLWQTIKAGGEWSGEFLNKAKDGSLFWERALITSIKDEAGRITHFLAVKEDITERKAGRRGVAANASAIDARGAAFDPGRDGGGTGPRAESPALRHPQLRESLPQRARRRRPARSGQPARMERGNRRHRLVGRRSREALAVVCGAAEAPRTACRIEEIVEEALGLVAVELRRARVTVETSFSAASPPVQVDRVQIQQVLVNLLSNAVEAMQTRARRTCGGLRFGRRCATGRSRSPSPIAASACRPAARRRSSSPT